MRMDQMMSATTAEAIGPGALLMAATKTTKTP